MVDVEIKVEVGGGVRDTIGDDAGGQERVRLGV